jgi:tRNA A37 threonylcarbamoyladenosine modification protein TsaB
MINLIIDAANDKILFKIITENESYTNEHDNNRENFDKFVILLFNFIKEKNIKIEEVDNIFINRGPGKFSSIRISISTVKALCFSKGINSNELKNLNYYNIIELFKKGSLKKNLIKPLYSS